MLGRGAGADAALLADLVLDAVTAVATGIRIDGRTKLARIEEWRGRFDEAAAWITTHGREPTSEGAGSAHYKWLSDQRSFHQAGELPEPYCDVLDTLTFDWRLNLSDRAFLDDCERIRAAFQRGDLRGDDKRLWGFMTSKARLSWPAWRQQKVRELKDFDDKLQKRRNAGGVAAFFQRPGAGATPA